MDKRSCKKAKSLEGEEEDLSVKDSETIDVRLSKHLKSKKSEYELIRLRENQWIMAPEENKNRKETPNETTPENRDSGTLAQPNLPGSRTKKFETSDFTSSSPTVDAKPHSSSLPVKSEKDSSLKKMENRKENRPGIERDKILERIETEQKEKRCEKIAKIIEKADSKKCLFLPDFFLLDTEILQELTSLSKQHLLLILTTNKHEDIVKNKRMELKCKIETTPWPRSIYDYFKEHSKLKPVSSETNDDEKYREYCAFYMQDVALKLTLKYPFLITKMEMYVALPRAQVSNLWDNLCYIIKKFLNDNPAAAAVVLYDRQNCAGMLENEGYLRDLRNKGIYVIVSETQKDLKKNKYHKTNPTSATVALHEHRKSENDIEKKTDHDNFVRLCSQDTDVMKLESKNGLGKLENERVTFVECDEIKNSADFNIQTLAVFLSIIKPGIRIKLMSGDKGFYHIASQIPHCSVSPNPHSASIEEVYEFIAQIDDTAQKAYRYLLSIVRLVMITKVLHVYLATDNVQSCHIAYYTMGEQKACGIC